jgi:hypothetical protein
MTQWILKGEYFVDKSIPYLLIALFFVIIIDLFFHHEFEQYHAYISIVDWAVMSVFMLDLIFKYNRVRDVPEFIRRYWIDIIAVFPFYLLFRLIDEALMLTGFTGVVEGVQPLVHEAVEAEKAGSKAANEMKSVGKTARFESLFRLFRPLQRFPRLLKVFSFYKSPKHYKALRQSLKLGRI